MRVAETGEAVPGYGAGGTPAFPGGHPLYIEPDTWFTSCPGIGQGAWIGGRESLPPCGGVPPGSAGVSPASLFLGGGCGALLRPCGPGSRPFGVKRNGKPQGIPRRPCRSFPVADTGEAVPDNGAGGTPAVPGGLPPHHKPHTSFTSCPGFGQETLWGLQESLPPRGGVPPGNAGVPPASLFLGGGRGALLRPCGLAAGLSA